MSWNQPQCERCWVDQHTNADGAVRVPTRVIDTATEPVQCAWCGYPTWAGIWRRADPATLLYPYKEEK